MNCWEYKNGESLRAKKAYVSFFKKNEKITHSRVNTDTHVYPAGVDAESRKRVCIF